MNHMPPEKAPIRELNHPMRYGPAKPPRLPNELINPILAAAAVEPRKLLGMAQMGGFAATIPADPRASRNRATGTSTVAIASVARPAAAISRGTDAWQRRSPVRSDSQPFSSIAGTPTSAGIAVSSDDFTTDRWPRR